LAAIGLLDLNLLSFLLFRGGSMANQAIRLVVLAISCVIAFSLPISTPLHAQYYRWPPPPLPGPPYPYAPNYPYASNLYGSGYSGCPAGYITIRGDVCEPYFPLIGGGVRGPDGCPPHYKLHGALCKPTRQGAAQQQ